MSDIYSRIQSELISSGNYKEIYTLLETELRNSGWYDNFIQLTEKTIENTNDKDLQFNKLVSALQDKGIQSVPDDVKIKVIQKIAEFLNTVVE
ncbi:SAGA histone acetylase and TREX-2 complexes component [Pichia californica]|uniref:Transcription and mRNA export factor SUS1 n=1 Tax=Pichia californica TaxID=460514 RepID=A0A9P6WH21_9ASCO|nr:SAGA histone acetylase and TREX-2 complexes component [[Candida] californica]KAG0686726.1 SAGA histone acetylase and TREX-2 complexes component [[Candida] californica]